jgi:hypothetical protein
MQLQQKIRTARLAWPELFLWVLLGIPLLHLGLLFGITDSHTPQAIAIQALRPLDVGHGFSMQPPCSLALSLVFT